MAVTVNDTAVQNPSAYRGSRLSPTGLAGAVAVHAGVIAALVLLPSIPIVKEHWKTLTATNIPMPVPEKTPPAPQTQPKEEAKVFTPHQQVVLPTQTRFTTEDPIPFTPPVLPPMEPEILPLPELPLVAATADPRAAFQPDYPPAMMRIEQEGTVTVRVHIGTNGRVLTVDRLSATNDSFWLATRKQALSQWRFRAATRGGVAVESDQTLTVHFKMN